MIYNSSKFKENLRSMDDERLRRIAASRNTPELSESRNISQTNVNRKREALRERAKNPVEEFTNRKIAEYIGTVKIASSLITLVEEATGLGNKLSKIPVAGALFDIGNLINSFLNSSPKEPPITVYNESISNGTPRQRTTVGHHIVFDVYTAPNATSSFTARSIHRAVNLMRLRPPRSVPVEGDHGSATWAVKIASLAAPTDSPEAGIITRTDSGEYIAQVKDAYFNKHLVDETFGANSQLRWNIAPTPNPGIAGPIEQVPVNSAKYEAEGTVLAGSHIATYEWETYRVGAGRWIRYLVTILSSLTDSNQVPGFSSLQSNTPETQKKTEEPEVEITFDGPGTYLLVLRVTDENRQRAEQNPDQQVPTDAIAGVGTTNEIVTVGDRTPTPRIDVVSDEGSAPTASPTDNEGHSRPDPVQLPVEVPREADSEVTLTGRASTAESQIRNYWWILIGPLPQSQLEAGVGSLDLNGFVDLLGGLSLDGSIIRAVTGESIAADPPDGGEFYFAGLPVETASGSWGVTYRPVKPGSSSGVDCSLDTRPPVDETSARDIIQAGEAHQYRFDIAAGDVEELSVSLIGGCPDLDLGVTRDGTTPERPGTSDRRSRSADSSENIVLENVGTIGIVIRAFKNSDIKYT